MWVDTANIQQHDWLWSDFGCNVFDQSHLDHKNITCILKLSVTNLFEGKASVLPWTCPSAVWLLIVKRRFCLMPFGCYRKAPLQWKLAPAVGDSLFFSSIWTIWEHQSFEPLCCFIRQTNCVVNTPLITILVWLCHRNMAGLLLFQTGWSDVLSSTALIDAVCRVWFKAHLSEFFKNKVHTHIQIYVTAVLRRTPLSYVGL